MKFVLGAARGAEPADDGQAAALGDIIVVMTDEPKTAIELVMERLRRKDAESGVEEKPLTDEQRAAIAEARSICEANVAQRRIMHTTAIMAVFDPAERAERDLELRRDIERFESDRDARIRKIHEGLA